MVPGVALNRDGNAVIQGGLVRKDPYYIDGAHSSNHVWSGNPVNPNPDVIQEFKVLTNSFSAEYGETSGGVMTSTTKSGTNEFHGTLFEFFRNDKLNAGNYYTHTVPIIRRNQFGGTIGGPIIKNRTFFFFDMQFTNKGPRRLLRICPCPLLRSSREISPVSLVGKSVRMHWVGPCSAIRFLIRPRVVP